MTLREWKQQYDCYQQDYDFRLSKKGYAETYEEQQRSEHWL